MPGQPTKAFRNRVLTNDHHQGGCHQLPGILQSKGAQTQ
nr:MAG TPA: hypothetical protein [Caudoviricetes sp.]